MDVKEEIRVLADNIALKRYNKEFEDLDEDIQYKIFIQAEMNFNNNKIDRAEALIDGELL